MALLRLSYTSPTNADFCAAIEARQRHLEELNREPAVRAIVDEAIAQAAAAAAMLRAQFGASRVRLFGSVARRDTSETFDVDLAVEGVPRTQFFAAWAAASQLVQRKLDLVDIDDAPALLRRRIEQDGIDLP